MLDDALSAVDARTEARILAALREALTGGPASSSPPPRGGSGRGLDLVLDEGRIVEEGVHADLIARGGRYWELLPAAAAGGGAGGGGSEWGVGLWWG